MNKKYVFFGTPHIAALSLEALKVHGMLPELIVTAPARPQGRGMHIEETPVAAFARENGIPFITPEKITPEVIELIKGAGDWDFFFVVAYGKILPQALLDAADNKVLNLHPSLLPKYRGPSPLETVLLSDDSETGVSIMELDALVDHGPIVAQSTTTLTEDITIETLTAQSATDGIDLLVQNIDAYINGEALLVEQNHDNATHTRKYVKADASLDGISNDWEKWKIFRAFGTRGWVHFTTTRHSEEIVVKITKASYNDDAFVIKEVIPANSKRQPYAAFLHSFD